MDNGPFTVKVITTSAMFVPLAWICAVPGPIMFIVTRVAGMVLPSQKKFAGVCTVATAVLLEEILTGIPSAGLNELLPGTVANKIRLYCTCWPTLLVDTLAFSQAITAPTCITIGVGVE